MRATERVWIGVLAVAATVPYLNTLGNGFAFDDRGMIVENPAVRGADASPWSFFTQPFFPGALYRPLTFLSYWTEVRLHGVTPLPFHLVNLGLHALVTVLFFLLCRSLRLGTAVSALAAGLFAVHPIHTEAVTNVIGRAEMLAAAAVLGALLCAVRGRSNAAWTALAAALFALGLLSKESAFVLLPLLFVCEWIRRPRRWRTIAAELTRSGQLPAFAAVGAAYLALRWFLFGTLTVGDRVAWLDNPLVQSSLGVRIGTATVVLVDSLAQLVLPLRLSADYSFNQIPLVESPADPRFLVAGAVLAVLALILWRNRAEAPAMAGGALFLLAALSLTSNFLFAIGTIRAERLLYLPSAGFCILAALAGTWALAQRPRLAAVAVASLLLLYAGRTWARNFDWASDVTLFQATVIAAPQSAKAHHNLGAALADAKRPDDAAMAFREALQIYPEYEEAAFGVGHMYDVRGLTAGALRWYRETLRIDPRHVKSYLNRGAILYNRGDLDGAEAEFRAGLAIVPEEPRLLTAVGFVRLAEGRIDEARSLLEQSQRLSPDDPETKRALAYAAQQKTGPMKGS